MNYYLCVGLGIYLTLYVISQADPTYSPGFLHTIAIFLSTLFFWPLELVLQLLKAREARTINQGLLDALEASVLNEQEEGRVLPFIMPEETPKEENKNEDNN